MSIHPLPWLLGYCFRRPCAWPLLGLAAATALAAVPRTSLAQGEAAIPAQVVTILDEAPADPEWKAIDDLARSIAAKDAGAQRADAEAARARAEETAAEAASAFLAVGDVTTLNRFIDIFYRALCPGIPAGAEARADAACPAWINLGEGDRARLMSLPMQYIMIRGRILEYETALAGTADPLVTPGEMLKLRRRHLATTEDRIKLASATLFERRGEVDADRYRQMRGALSVAAATVALYTGDAPYRLRGASLVTDLVDAEPGDASASFYGAARQALFEALILAPDNVEAKALAADLEDRLAWVRAGEAFGGRSFFEVEPVMGHPDGPEWTPLARLHGTINRLRDLESNDRVAERRGRINELAQSFAEELRQSRDRRRDEIRRLSQEISDLEYRISTGNLEAGQALEAQTRHLRQQMAQSDVARTELQQREKEIDGEVAMLLDELAAATAELSTISSKSDFITERYGNFASTATAVLEDTNRVIEAARQFNADEIKTRVKRLDDTIRELANVGETAISRLAADIQIVNARIDSISNATRAITEKIKGLEADYLANVAKQNEESLRNEIEQLESQIEAEGLGTAAAVDMIAERIYASTVGNIEREKAAIEQKVESVRAKFSEAASLIQLYETNRERVEEAIAAANVAVLAAGKMPSGIIAGTAAGTFTQMPEALMRVKELGLKIVENAQKVELDIRRAKAVITDLNTMITDYANALRELDAQSVEAELKRRMQEAVAQGNLARQELIDQIKASQLRIKVTLDESARRLKDRFDASTAELGAVRQQYEAEAGALQAEIRKIEQSIGLEKRKARDLVRRIEVLNGDLGRLQAEKSGLREAVSRVDTDAAATKAEIEQSSKIEEEQYDERSRPLIARLALLRAAVDRLLDGSTIGTVGLPVRAMTSAASTASVSETVRHRQSLIDEANSLLFQYANWLYLMTKDRRALEWAISAQGLSELEIAMRELDKLYAELSRTLGLATPRYFVARIPAAAVREMEASDDGTSEVIPFTVSPSMWRLADQPPQRLSRDIGEAIVDEDVFIYSPLEHFRQRTIAGGISAPAVELVFAPMVEGEEGALNILWDAWVIPNWQSEVPSEIAQIGLRPVGPTSYRLGAEAESVPVLRSRDANVTSTASSYAQVRQQHEQALRFITAGSGASLIDGTLPGMNYRSVLGRGLGNSWELSLPRQWSHFGDESPGIAALESVDIIFGYLVAPERSSGLRPVRSTSDVELAAGPSAGVDCTSNPRQAWLCSLQETYAFAARGAREQARTDGGQRSRHDFFRSAAAPVLRNETLSRMAAAMPKAHVLATHSRSDREGLGLLSDWRTATGDETVAPVRRAFHALFECRDEMDQAGEPECFETLDVSRLSYGELTRQVVRDEMLNAAPQSVVAVPSLELVRTWRSLSQLFGSPEEAELVSRGDSPTLLSELGEIATRLELLDERMTEIKVKIEGPMAVARRLAGDYETARLQIEFLDQLALGLSDLTTDAGGPRPDDEAAAERLKELLRRRTDDDATAALARFHCPEVWYMAARGSGASISDVALSLTIMRTLIDAIEPEFEDLIADEPPVPPSLASFPFPECYGVFVEASRALEVTGGQ